VSRGFLIFVLLAAGVFYGWDRGVTEDGIGSYIVSRPPIRGGDTVLYTLAGFHELWNQDKKALLNYQRLIRHYPNSRYGDSAHFGVASSYERLHQRAKALEAFKNYLKKYPQGRYSRSVSTNIGYLGG
jgi:TolA-binding protein